MGGWEVEENGGGEIWSLSSPPDPLQTPSVPLTAQKITKEHRTESKNICFIMEDMRAAKEKIDLLLQLINLDLDSLLNNKTSNLTVVNEYNLDFEFLQARTLIKEVETGLNVL